jgi:chromosome segregation ATPase
MRYLVLALLLSFAPQCFAQTASKPIKSKALLKAEAQLADAQAALQKANDQIAALTVERDKLTSQNEEISKGYLNALTTLRVLHKEMTLTALDEADQQAIKAIPPGDLLASAATIEKDFEEAVKVMRKLMSDNSEMVQKYNSLLAIAQSQDAQLQAANSRQQRINNALALYNAMPKYTPPQTINLQVTNCSAYPALCVH